MKMDWKHAYLRNATDEEKKELGCEEIWSGELPCEDSQILVYKNGYFTIDDWVNDLGECGLTENYDFTDFYWCELEAPDTGNEE